MEMKFPPLPLRREHFHFGSQLGSLCSENIISGKRRKKGGYFSSAVV
jgi:hypothetical protein